LGHRESSIFVICPDIRIELAFYSSMVGEPGQFRLEKLFLETMPTAAKAISVAATVLLLQQLFVGDLYGFCGVDVQGAVKSAQNSIHAVAEGRDPHMHGNNVTKFLAEVAGRIKYYCRFTDATGSVSFGEEALFAEIDAACGKLPAVLAAVDVALTTDFLWMLKKESHVDKIKGLRKILADNASSSTTSCAILAKPATKAGAKPKKGVGEKTEVQSALDMFRCKKKPKLALVV
jgi:hypothetical protein